MYIEKSTTTIYLVGTDECGGWGKGINGWRQCDCDGQHCHSKGRNRGKHHVPRFVTISLNISQCMMNSDVYLNIPQQWVSIEWCESCVTELFWMAACGKCVRDSNYCSVKILLWCVVGTIHGTGMKRMVLSHGWRRFTDVLGTRDLERIFKHSRNIKVLT